MAKCSKVFLASLFTLLVSLWAFNASAQESPAGGRWLELGGSDIYYAADNPSLNIGDDPLESLTIEAWVFAHSFPDQQRIIIAAKPGAYELALSCSSPPFATSRSFDFCASHKGGFSTGIGLSLDGETDWLNRWLHVAGVFDNETDEISIFVDGQGTTSNPIMGGILDSESPLVIGGPISGSNSGDGFFDGALDELRISDVPRYDGHFKPIEAPFKPDEYTMTLYHFDGPGPWFDDDSGHGNTLRRWTGISVMTLSTSLTATWGALRTAVP